VVYISSDPEHSTATQPASGVQGVYATPLSTAPADITERQQPSAFQYVLLEDYSVCTKYNARHPMQRVIVIRCGTDLKSRISIHEHVLCRHSGKMNGIATKAKSQREAYDDCEDILEQVTSISMAGLSPAQFEKMGLRAKVSHCCRHQDSRFLIIVHSCSR
jgi:hypothetical protein